MHEILFRRAKRFLNRSFNSNVEAPNYFDRRGLLDPPVSLPSIPIVDPLVNPVVHGQKSMPNPGNNTPNTTPPPQQDPPNPGNGKGPANGRGGDGNTWTPPTSGSSSTDVLNPNTNASPDAPTPTPTPSPTPSPTSGSSPSQSTGLSHNGPVNLSGPSSQGSNSSSSPRSSDRQENVVFTTISGVRTEVTQLPHSTNGHSGNVPAGGGGNGDGSGNGTNSSKGGGPGPGIVAAIVIGTILALALFVFFLRKRVRKQRAAQHMRWLSSGEKGPRTTIRSSFGDLRASTFVYNSEDGHDRPDSKRYSGPFSDSMAVPTPASANSTLQTTQVTHTEIALPAAAMHSTGRRSSRNSQFSIGSSESGMTDGSDGQWLEIRTDVGYNDGGGGLSPTSQFCPASPISVRPFTPTESWSFPKPPTSRGEPITHSGEDKGFVNPDPFVDPVSQPSPAGFSQVETVTRTFEPEAEDQLVVEIGDEVSVLMVFDDGWGKVKVLRRNGSTKSVQGLEGLIPIDCLRPKGDENPLFVDVSAN